MREWLAERPWIAPALVLVSAVLSALTGDWLVMGLLLAWAVVDVASILWDRRGASKPPS